jgi:hypothetical protein
MLKSYLLIFCAFIFIHQNIFSQEKTAKGIVMDKYSRQLLEGVKISVKNTDISVYSDESGKFQITVPKKHHYLTFSRDSYKSAVTALKPGFHLKTLYTYLTPIVYDSLYNNIKNVFTLSLIELFNGALALRYEHFLKWKHAIGIHSSFYLFGRNPTTLGSEYDNYVKYYGVKASPFYRYYIIRNSRFGLYGEGKVQLGYIHFSELGYYYSSYYKMYKEESFWSTGFGISIGIMFKGSKRVMGNLSVGYQYFPIHVPESIEALDPGGTTLSTYTADTNWWYMGGPGSYLDIKFTLGLGY